MTESWKQWEGQMIADSFPLQQYLGGEGDHAVFLTEHGQPAQKAEIKILLGNPERTKDTLRRWSLAAKLSHPHLVRIFSVGRWQLGETPAIYAVTEFTDQSLAEVIPVRPLTPEEARQTLEPAAGALAYLHAQGFVHGHLKPEQIRAAGESLKITSTEVSLAAECAAPAGGDYGPPEQVVSPAADVWALGVILVEALTQHRPARKSRGELDIPATLPAPFSDIARECLRSDPATRATAAELAARFQPGKRPRLKWSYALAAAAGLVLGAVVIAPRLIDRQQPAPSPVETEQVPAAPPAQARQATPAQIPQVPPVQPPAGEEAARPAAPARDEIIQRVLPQVPSQAARTIQGRVRVSVRVRVDPSGKVTEARLDSSGPSRYFAQLALQAARRWKFVPLEIADRERPREWILHFEISRTGTRVAPVRRSS